MLRSLKPGAGNRLTPLLSRRSEAFFFIFIFQILINTIFFICQILTDTILSSQLYWISVNLVIPNSDSFTRRNLPIFTFYEKQYFIAGGYFKALNSYWMYHRPLSILSSRISSLSSSKSSPCISRESGKTPGRFSISRVFITAWISRGKSLKDQKHYNHHFFFIL